MTIFEMIIGNISYWLHPWSAWLVPQLFRRLVMCIEHDWWLKIYSMKIGLEIDGKESIVQPHVTSRERTGVSGLSNVSQIRRKNIGLHLIMVILESGCRYTYVWHSTDKNSARLRHCCWSQDDDVAFLIFRPRVIYPCSILAKFIWRS